MVNMIEFIIDFIYDCYWKISKQNIFTTEETTNVVLTNNKKLKQMDESDRRTVVTGLEVISLYNQDFSILCKDFLCSPSQINLEKFQKFIREEKRDIMYLKLKLL